MFIAYNSFAQEVIVTDSTAIQPEEQIAESTKEDGQRRKVDGIAAVVGNYIILDSDIDMMYKDMQSQGISTSDVSDCELTGSLLENKLYAHHAIQDSIIVMDAEIQGQIDQQLAEMVRQVGSIDKVLEFYQKESEEQFREELFKINKERQLASRMQQKIIEDVEITPDEIREYFKSIPEEDLPIFGDEVEISQIVVEPRIPEEERQKVIKRLNEFKVDIEENDASFSTKAILYSQDPGTSSEGGKITLTRSANFVQEFKDVAFSLREGEFSEPFETEFGYHIIQVDRIRGENVDLRHILLIPDVTNATTEEAKKKIDSIRKRIQDKELDFAEAAREFSDEEETKSDGGKLRNPQTGDTRFELANIDPEIYGQVVNLEEGEISYRLLGQDPTGRPFFKIIMVTKRRNEHKADFATDYMKIKELALRDKQMDAIAEWQADKIANTYIKINGKYRDCDYNSKWIKY